MVTTTRPLPTCSIALTLVCASCGAEAPSSAPGPRIAFDGVFAPAGHLAVEEVETDPIIDVGRIAASEGGRLAFADRRGHRARVFDPAGGARVDVGRLGDGPGEFRTPLSVAFDRRGRLYVSDVNAITRFTPELALDTVITIPGVAAINHVHALTGDRLLAGISTGRQRGAAYRVLSLDGEVLHSFHVPDSLFHTVPYWISVQIEHAAATAGVVALASNLLYPIHLYDEEGSLLRTIGTPPPSWMPASRPEAGRFANRPLSELSEWLSSFRQITGLGFVGDSTLVVVHGRFDPSIEGQFSVKDSTLDLYSLGGAKLHEDVPVPGRFLGSAGGELFFLVSEPPEGWGVRRYRLLN